MISGCRACTKSPTHEMNTNLVCARLDQHLQRSGITTHRRHVTWPTHVARAALVSVALRDRSTVVSRLAARHAGNSTRCAAVRGPPNTRKSSSDNRLHPANSNRSKWWQQWRNNPPSPVTTVSLRSSHVKLHRVVSLQRDPSMGGQCASHAACRCTVLAWSTHMRGWCLSATCVTFRQLASESLSKHGDTIALVWLSLLVHGTWGVVSSTWSLFYGWHNSV